MGLLFLVGICIQPTELAKSQTTAILPSRPGSPGFIVMMPVTDQTQDHLRLAATFVTTGDIVDGSRLLATALLPSGQRLLLREFSPQPFSAHGGHCPGAATREPSECSAATSYPLTGFGLPTNSLPLGSQVDVYLSSNRSSEAPPNRHTNTRHFLNGIGQTADGMIRISGDFKPELPVDVYINFWLHPYQNRAVQVATDSVVVDPKKDPGMPKWIPDLYPITVCQPGIGCDTLLLRLLATKR